MSHTESKRLSGPGCIMKNNTRRLLRRRVINLPSIVGSFREIVISFREERITGLMLFMHERDN